MYIYIYIYIYILVFYIVTVIVIIIGRLYIHQQLSNACCMVYCINVMLNPSIAYTLIYPNRAVKMQAILYTKLNSFMWRMHQIGNAPYKDPTQDPVYQFCVRISGIFSIMPNLISLLLLLTAARQSVSQLTNAQKQLLLDLHNQARSDVSPTAANMEQMVSAESIRDVHARPRSKLMKLAAMHACSYGYIRLADWRSIR